MTWRLTADVGEFLAAAGGFLRSRPAEHTILLTVSHMVADKGRPAFGADPPRFGWWAPGGEVGAVFLQTPPYPVLLSGAPAEAVVALAGALAADERPLSAVNADVDAADVFAAEWRKRTGAAPGTGRRSRLYRLGSLNPPTVPGVARVAGPGDRELLIEWYHGFGDDVGEHELDEAAMVEDRLGYGGLTVWQVDGVPVAMAGATRPLYDMVRVAPVYTPEPLRRNGYGGAATAAVSRAALDAGATDVVLFTDLANPTSNALYQRLGYRPVHDRVILTYAAD
jgi:hypothetical protein